MQNYAEIVQPHEVFESVSKKPLILAIVFTLAGLCVSSEAIFGQSAVRASQGVLDGNKIKDVKAIYPNMARVAHVQGDVVLRAAISKTGVVENLFNGQLDIIGVDDVRFGRPAGPSVPDAGSSALLLSLGIMGLVGFQRALGVRQRI